MKTRIACENQLSTMGRIRHGLIALFEINSKTQIRMNHLRNQQSNMVKGHCLEYKRSREDISILKRKGYEFLVEPTVYEKKGDSEYIKAGLYKEMSFYDHDGFLINLIELTDSIYL
ncbi:MAG: hypothetical protein Ct9H90mP13_10010 [Pseudomonadota bacterium]|nr:MAG: hypothetical protein Ct9H90mP13_10010 [Pseudomonadota bacterium]